MFSKKKIPVIVYYFQDVLEIVFENGKLLKDYTFSEVREKAEIDLVKNLSEVRERAEIGSGKKNSKY